MRVPQFMGSLLLILFYLSWWNVSKKQLTAYTKDKQDDAFREIKQYLADIEPLAAAAIACKLTFDKVFSYKDGSNKITEVCDSIGRAVEDECQMRHYEACAPGLLRVLKENYWHRSCGTQQKLVVIRTLMNRYKVKEWKPWGAC